jgi:hypothetical protein
MHNPRGSNNRCDRRTNDRANANRLFDSQNNAAGGYAVACDRPDGATTQEAINCYKMNYYQGSELQLRWASQHNCGINNDCQFIIQYSCEGEGMLGSNIRDGHPQNSEGNTCTETIPDVLDSDMVNSNKYGKHEDYGNYQRCKNRLRNKRLFTADQKLKGNSAIYTRQNPVGTRYGFECPEERDYYPYWSNSPWIDIAVLTNEPDRCPYYYKESQCVSPKFECVGISQSVRDSINVKGIPNTQLECDNLGGHWIKFDSFNSLDNVPNCNFTCSGSPPSSAINRLGESISFEAYLDNNTQPPKTHQAFTWVLPTFKEDLRNCVLRIRYNISTYETPWNFTIDDNDRLKNNPVMNTSNGAPVRMAIDTSQYGRIFEDRSHTFNIIKRPLDLLNKNIHNINVQGKRGNIAQIRNCIEYDFVPNNITITEDDYLHFQWVGSDYNPIGNDGEGRDGTDRSNLVVINSIRDNIPYQGIQDINLDIFDVVNNFILASVRQDILNPDKCFTWEELTSGNQRNNKQSHKNCALLNSASPYFNMEPIKVIKGVKQCVMMCSRNNNFSNRGQKLIITVKSLSIISDNGVNTNNDHIKANKNENIKKEGTPYSALIAYCLVGVLVCVIIVLAIISRRNYLKRIARYRHAEQNNTNPDNTSYREIQISSLQRVYRNIKRNFQSKV